MPAEFIKDRVFEVMRGESRGFDGIGTTYFSTWKRVQQDGIGKGQRDDQHVGEDKYRELKEDQYVGEDGHQEQKTIKALNHMFDKTEEIDTANKEAIITLWKRAILLVNMIKGLEVELQMVYYE